jgi:hypothetical protein
MANKIYVVPETVKEINGEVGADAACSMEGLTNGAGRVSAQLDLGATAHSGMYAWVCFTQWQATPTKNETLDLYLAEAGNATDIAGDVGTSDAALGSLDQLSNLRHIGEVNVETADTTKMVASGIIEIRHRYVSLVVVNNGGSTLNATDSNSNFLLYPVPDEVQ